MSLEKDFDLIKVHITDDRRVISECETNLKHVRDRQAAAKELLVDADERLALPRRPEMPCDFYVEPTSDKREAEAVLAVCAEEIQRLEQRLAGVKADLARWEKQQQTFNMDALRREQHRGELRRRMGSARR